MSLLKRIEQGQGNSSDQSNGPSQNGGGDVSRLSSLQARRVTLQMQVHRRGLILT